MNDKEAIRLLNDTFSSEFDLRKFTHFLNELFNGFYPQDKSIITHIEYEQHIISIKKIGNFRQKEKSMKILIVKLKKGSSLDKARAMQRNVVAKLLRNFNIDSALVAFISEDLPDWRFSFIKMDYKLAEDGKVSEELTPAIRYSFLVGPNEPNHTCRKQFLELIKNEKQKPSIEEIESAFSIERVTKEFFERYKNLYFKLKENLDKLVEKDKNLREEFEDKEISTVDFSKKLLGQIVFLYFLQKKGWLGIKRGKERKFEQWGQGPKNFIKELFEKAKQENKNFFNDFLEPLFYEALAEDRRANDNYYSRFDCKIPFLNGGLFEPINDYSWGETDINLDNSIFEEILGTFNEFNFTIKEDEPLEKEVAIDPEMLGKVFENLIEENIRKGQGAYYTPREIVYYMCQQSLINYLETNIKLPRKDIEFFIQKGDLALEYLRRLDFGKPVNKSAVLPETIIKNAKELDKLLVEIKICDPAVGSGAFPVGMMNEIIKARTILSYILKKSKSDYELKRETIENSLYGVDIEPSAVEITKLRFWLSLIVDEEDINNINPLPNLENKIMCGNSLLEEFEGIKLFDEKLVGTVEEDKSHEISRIENEMSNLYQELGKIHTGKQKDQNGRSKEIQKAIKKLQKQRNELAHGKKQTDRNMTLEEASEQKIKESQKKLKELRELQQKFFNEQNRSQKKKYAQQIDKIEWDLIEETLKEQGDNESIKKLQEYKKRKIKPFFLWRLYFSDVFQNGNTGFDIVIANPPYIGQKGNTKLFEVMKKDPGFEKKMDYWYFFLYRAYNINKEEGITTFITPNYWITARGARKLREKIVNEYEIKEWINFNENKIFEAGIHTNVFILKKSLKKNPILKCTIYNKNYESDFIQNKDKELNFTVNQDSILKKWTGFVHFLPQKTLNITDKLINNSEKLCDTSTTGIKKEGVTAGKHLTDGICNLNQGLVTGKDRFVDKKNNINEGVFVVNIGEAKNLFTKNDKERLKEFYKNSDISQYFVSNSPKYYLIYVNDIESESILKKYPSIYNHLLKYKKILLKRSINGVLESAYKKGKWWALTTDRPNINFNGEKILCPQRSRINTFGYSDNTWYAASDVFYISLNKKEYSLKYLLSILNSKLVYYWLFYMGKRKGGILELTLEPLQFIPIKKISQEQQKSFIKLVDQMLSIKKDDDYLDSLDKQKILKKLEKELDQLVYKLYELTPEEIKIVEEFNK